MKGLTLFGLLCALFAQAGASGVEKEIALNDGWTLQDIAKVTESGQALSMPSYRSGGWYKATVPGTVLTSLVDDGVYPEPLYGMNNLLIPESLARTSYWYRKSLEIPKAYAGKRVWLRFDGINYQAEVWVNGHDAGTIKGAFIRGLFDITSFVSEGQTAAIAVKIDPQPHPGESHQKTIAAGTGRNGGETARDGPTFLCTVGWDWIPTIRDRATGMWQGVSMYSTGAVVIHDPYVSSEIPLPKTDTADLTVETTLENVTGQPVSCVLTGSSDPFQFKVPVSLQPHESKKVVLTPAQVPSLHVRRPRLWWPNGYGPQNLYTIHLSVAAEGAVSDRWDNTFGIRKISYSLPGSDNLALSVNGVPVFCKGGDWGIDEAMKRIRRKRLEAQIRMHAMANYTMIRNWVGQSTSEDFYDLCDRYGILVWDEFFQANPYDGPNPDDTELYLSNVRDKLLRFRNHPSIALWCARNEGDPPPAIHQGIDRLYEELDGKRLYHANSGEGRGVRSGGPYHWRPPQEFYKFNEPFKTEIGSVSMPTIEALHAMMPREDWATVNEDWAEHDFTKGAQGGDRFPIQAGQRFGPIVNTEDLVRKGQMMTYEAFRAMYEGRQSKLFTPSTGVITWMSNPAQPSFVWQLYTHDLEPNAALFAARKACEPVHIQVNQDNWRAMVINNTPVTVSGVAKVSVYSLDGKVADSHTFPVSAKPSAATDLGEIGYPAGSTPVQFVVAELKDGRGKLVSENLYWRGAAEHPDDLALLDSLPTVTIEATATSRVKGSTRLFDVALVNSSASFALMVHVQLRHKSGGRVLPVYYSDNYVSLPPGAKRTIRIEADSSDVGSDGCAVAVDGWNVTVKPTAGVVPVFPNEAAGRSK